MAKNDKPTQEELDKIRHAMRSYGESMYFDAVKRCPILDYKKEANG